jgi:hypothetical protein
MMTPNGRRKQAAGVGMPVRAENAADPPVKSIAVTKMFVKRPKTVKTRWAAVPYLARMSSKKVYIGN